MDDLISRQAAIKALDERCESECEYSKKQRSIMCDACYLGSAKEVIEALPTIDAVPVVRCKDCKYYRESKMLSPQKFCFRSKSRDGIAIGYNFAEDDFCSYGERSEDAWDLCYKCGKCGRMFDDDGIMTDDGGTHERSEE